MMPVQIAAALLITLAGARNPGSARPSGARK